MHAQNDETAGFARFGPPVPSSPLVVSVPHAGREYPAALLAATHLPGEALVALEDRLADRLADGLPALGITGLIARRARAWIDLNRDPCELDPAMIQPPPRPSGLLLTAKVRGGLGLIPRRIAGAGDIYPRRLSAADVQARIAADHAPWHDAIATALAAAQARFGIACLIDLHSMPPLAATIPGEAPARIVIGDRNGRSSGRTFVERLHAAIAARGLPVSINRPYAGAYTLERHGDPAAGIHAIQLELDRALYLAPDMRMAGDGLEATTRLVADLAAMLLRALAEATPPPQALAAE